ncbi:MAG: pseudouridine synthase [Chitinophagia bacterium]
MNVDRYFLLNKPMNMVSQFVSTHKVQLLSNIDFDFPEGTHAIGRLDQMSEGLLLLTTNKKVTKLLFQGMRPHIRTYLVQVKNKVSQATLKQLRDGVDISAPNGSTYKTAACKVDIIDPPIDLWENGIVLHENQQSDWLSIELTEGKFHQVRKMVATMHHRCIRLVRWSIEDLTVESILPGQVQEVSEAYFFKALNL